MIKRLKKLAEVFKPNKFHYALLDYLADELRSNNVRCRKQSSYIKIKLEKLVEEKFDHVIIDCFNGGIYLRGEGVKDKKILKLNRFYGDRESDAMNCACGGSKQIMRYLESLNTSDELIVESKKKVDMRKTADLKGRDFAIAIINGEVFSGDTHGEAITNYLKENDINDISVYDRHELESIMGYGFKNQFAAAHAQGDIIYLEPETLENITLEQAANLISHNYPGYKIINIDNNERIAKLKDIRKIAHHADDTRDLAIVYINGEFYEGYTHAEAVNKYLENKNLKLLNDDYFRPNVNNDKSVNVDYSTDEKIEDQKTLEVVEQIAFAHKIEYGHEIYIEPDTLKNLDLMTAANAFKKEYPNYDIFDDNSYNGDYNYDEDGNNNYKKIARLKKMARDINNRDNEGAIVYIDGQILIAKTHAEAISNYLAENCKSKLNDNYFRPFLYNKNCNPMDDFADEALEDVQIIADNINQLAFAHKDNNTIYIEQNTLQNVDINTVTKSIKNAFQNFDICLDETNEKVASLIDMRIIKISRLKKIARDRDERDYNNGAIVYIDGELFEGDTHGQAIANYLFYKSKCVLNDNYYRPYIYDRDYNSEEELTTEEKQDIEMIKNNIKQLAFSHKDSDENTIYIERDTLQNVDINTVANAIKKQYPNFDICLDETDEKVAKLTDMRIIKISRLKRNAMDLCDRDYNGALVYINGELIVADTHAQAINKYLQKHTDETLVEDWYRPYYYNQNENYIQNYKPNSSDLKDKQIIDNNVKQIAFAHIVSNEENVISDNKNIIYIERDTLQNVDIDTVKNAIKKEYPNYDIAIEETYEKIAKLKKLSWHDVSDRDAALACIDGEVIEAETHALCVDKYLKEHNNTSLNEQQLRPNINIEVDDAWDDSQAEDLQNIYDNINQICFGHIDKTNKVIYLEPEGLNITVNDLSTIGQIVKGKYSDYKILIDNAANTDFEQVAKLKKSRLKKLSGFHDKNNRTSAILYIEGEVLEGLDHYDMITQYMKEKYNLNRNNPDQERETDKLFDSLSYAMGSKVDEDKTIYIDDDTLNYVDEQTVINTINTKYPNFNVEIETSTKEDMYEYMGGTFEEMWKKYQENELKKAQ